MVVETGAGQLGVQPYVAVEVRSLHRLRAARAAVVGAAAVGAAALGAAVVQWQQLQRHRWLEGHLHQTTVAAHTVVPWYFGLIFLAH